MGHASGQTATNAIQAHAPTLAHSSRHSALDDNNATYDEFEKHKAIVLSGKFHETPTLEGTSSDDAHADTQIQDTFTLFPETRQSYLVKIETNARHYYDCFRHALSHCATEVEAAMASRRDIIRSFVGAGLIPRADDDTWEQEAVDIVLDALQEESRDKVGQELVDKKRMGVEPVVVQDVLEYVRKRIASLMHRAKDLTDTQVYYIEWAFVERSYEQTLAQIERRLVEALFLDHCTSDGSVRGNSGALTMPCCVYVRSNVLSRWRHPSRLWHRDAVVVPSTPLNAFWRLMGITAEFNVTMFPCRLMTPNHGMKYAVLACDWNIESSNRDGHCIYYLAKFITDYYLAVAASHAESWREEILVLEHHVHRPLFNEEGRALAHKLNSSDVIEHTRTDVMRTWIDDMAKLQRYFAPPTQQSLRQVAPMRPPGAGSPRHYVDQRDASDWSSQQYGAHSNSSPNSTVLHHEWQDRLDQQEPYMERHSFTCGDQGRRVSGSKRPRSQSQGPPEQRDFGVDFEFSDEPHRRSA